MSAGPERTEPAMPAPPMPASQPQQPADPVGPSMAAFGGTDTCPNCGAQMAADQRYCLNCGQRRGEPRLPFMDAVVFMESIGAPPGGGTPPPPPTPSGGGSSPRMNANAALIAGVATLVLAIGVGFLIGRSGNDSSNSAAEAPIKVIEVGGGGGGGESTETAGTGESTESSGKESGKEKGGSKKPAIKTEGNKATKKAEKNVTEGAHGQTEAAEKVLHTESGIELETEVEVGGKCTPGAAGCGSSGKFEGNFFGE